MIKTYNVTFDRKKNKGVYGISLVENPAMEGTFIALAKQEIKLATIDKEKKELIGLVLEPNKPIYRNSNGEEFNIIFTEDTIKELLIGFSENGNQNNSTIEHDEKLKLKGVTFFENWIVEDEENDKSNAFGLNAKKGSWITKLKIDDEMLWENFVKTGFVKGFSVDALINLEEIKLNNNMNKVGLNEESKSWFEALLNKVISPKKEEVKLEEDVKDKEEEKKEEMEEENKPAMTDEMKDNLMKAIAEVLMQMKSEIVSDFETKLNAVKDENEKLKAEVVELGKQPVAKAVKSAPTQIEFDKMTALQKRRYLRENG